MQHTPPAWPPPCSGLLPLDERVSHTPAVARALHAVTQLHSQQQRERGQGQSACLAAQGGDTQTAEEGPTMGDLQRRASSLEPYSGGRPPKPSALGEALGAPAGLAPIRTSVSPGEPAVAAQQQGREQAQRQLRASVERSAAADGQACAAASGDACGDEAEAAVEVEAVCLSQAWSVFEALMRQAPATQVGR